MTPDEVRTELLMRFAQGAGHTGNKFVSAAAIQALDGYFDTDLLERLGREWKLVKPGQKDTVGKVASLKARKNGQHAAIEADQSPTIDAKHVQHLFVPCIC